MTFLFKITNDFLVNIIILEGKIGNWKLQATLFLFAGFTLMKDKVPHAPFPRTRGSIETG